MKKIRHFFFSSIKEHFEKFQELCTFVEAIKKGTLRRIIKLESSPLFISTSTFNI